MDPKLLPLLESVQQNREDVWSWMQLGDVAKRLEDWGTAFLAYLAASRLKPENIENRRKFVEAREILLQNIDTPEGELRVMPFKLPYKTAVILVIGILNFDNGPLHKQVKLLIGKGFDKILLDCTGLTYITGLGPSTLRNLTDYVEEMGGRMVVVKQSDEVKEMLRLKEIVVHEFKDLSEVLKIFSMSKMAAYCRILRPFTLLPPALGMISGSFIALGVSHFRQWHQPSTIWKIAAGCLLAAILNGASNILNQIYDLEADKINKSDRPLVTKEISIEAAWLFSIICYLLAIAIAWWINYQCLLMVLIAAFCTIFYSVPPLRTKKHWLAAAITIAVPRGILLKVAGWSVLLDIYDSEPWYIGTIFGLFLLGATSTKDYADIKGDRANQCITLPIRFGVKKSAWLITPFLTCPFLLFPLGVFLKILTGNALLIHLLGITLFLWGSYITYLLLRDPDSLTNTENHPSWKHMYLMMMYAQFALAVAYLL